MSEVINESSEKLEELDDRQIEADHSDSDGRPGRIAINGFIQEQSNLSANQSGEALHEPTYGVGWPE